MNRLFGVLLIAGMIMPFSACFKGPAATLPSKLSKSLETSSASDVTASSDPADTTENSKETITTCITIGDKKFTAILYDNSTSHALLERFPLSVEMQELNGNEKYYRFKEALPTNIESIGNIKAGDLMLYQDDYLVMFYESHTTSYSYTRIGYVEDITGLAEVVGNGSITASFGIQNND